jgi:hypothetical protein
MRDFFIVGTFVLDNAPVYLLADETSVVMKQQSVSA